MRKLIGLLSVILLVLLLTSCSSTSTPNYAYKASLKQKLADSAR